MPPRRAAATFDALVPTVVLCDARPPHFYAGRTHGHARGSFLASSSTISLRPFSSPVPRIHPSRLPLAPLFPFPRPKDDTVILRRGGGKVWFGVSAKIGRFRRYVPVVRNRIVPCFRECITVIGPLEGASAKGSAGGKSVSGALPPTRVRFHASSLFTLNHLRDGGGGEGLAASMRNHRSKTLNDKLSVWNSKCWEISVEIGVRFANFRIGIKKWFKKKPL